MIGGVHRLAEDGESAGVDHGGDDVLAVGEGDDRELDPHHVAELGSQRILGHWALSSGFSFAPRRVEAGATLVQLYTGLIYEGPALVGACARALRAAASVRPAKAAQR